MSARTIQLTTRDQRLHDLVDPHSQLQRVASGFAFTEGPVWDTKNARLIWSDIVGDKQYCWSQHGGLQVFRAPSTMANGNTFDREGRLLTCEHATSRVVRAEHDGTTSVLATHYDEQELNSPNDIVVDSFGAIYFTDPLSGRSARYGVERPSALGFQGVYRIDPNTGALSLLADDFVLPNGLCFSGDEQRLFVNDTRRNHIRVFDVQTGGTLAGGSVWAEVNGEGEGAPDGMKIDAAGNVWCSGPGGIHVFAPDAALLGVIHVPERAANFAWGGTDLHRLFVTASTSVYALQTRIPGGQARTSTR